MLEKARNQILPWSLERRTPAGWTPWFQPNSASRTIREYISVALATKCVVMCYSRYRKLINTLFTFKEIRIWCKILSLLKELMGINKNVKAFLKEHN